MTKQTWQPRVIAIVVLELGEVGRGRLRRRMGKQSSFASLHRWPRDRTEVARRHRPATEGKMALRANKGCALLSLVYLVVENSTVIQRRRNVTAFTAAA